MARLPKITVLSLLLSAFLFAASCGSPEKNPGFVSPAIPPGAFGDLGNGFYLNPIFPGDYPDPTILRDGADYYMTHTPHDNSPGLIVWHSRDLVNWKAIGHALTADLGEIWAPDFVKYKNRYYIYFPNRTTRSNCVVTADQPAGPWSDPIDLKVGNIDPGHVVGEDGNRYLYFSDGNMIRLAEDGLSTVGAVRKVYEGWPYPEDWRVECFCLESPKLIRRGEYFYLISAQGGTSGPATSHMAVAARSKSVFGPWENSPYNPVVHTQSATETWWSKGHASLIDTPSGGWYVVYHAYKNNRRTLGRMTLLEPIEWTADGWPRLPEGSDPARPIPMPRGENIGSTIDRQIDFETDFRAYRWQANGSFDPVRFSFSGNRLRMKSRGEDPAGSGPFLFMPHHDRYQAAVEVTINPAAPPPGRVTAPGLSRHQGLMLYYGPQFYYGCGLGPDGLYVYTERGRRKVTGLPGGETLHLKIVNDDQTVGLYRSPDGKTWTRVEDARDVSPYQTNLLRGFRSLRIALFSCGGGAAETEFRNFVYSPWPVEK